VRRMTAGTLMNSCELLAAGYMRRFIHGATVIGEPGGTEIGDRVRASGRTAGS
jgi:hypothetical protein